MSASPVPTERELAYHRRRAERSEAAFRARLAELGAHLLEPQWLGSNKPHRVRCVAGHECAPRPCDLKPERVPCPACPAKDSRAAEATFRARLTELGATLLEPKWLGHSRHHQVRCAAGHLTRAQPNHVQQGGGVCALCAGRSIEGAEAKFKASLAKLGATLLETEWLGGETPHRIRCAKGHEVTVQPGHLRSRNGNCRICSRRDSSTAAREFSDRLTELGAVLLEPEWLGNGTPHRTLCAAGHECSPRPDAVRQGQGVCRYCAGKSWDVFYVLTDETSALLKFGITTGGGQRRLATHRRNGFTTVHRLLLGLTDTVAPQLERDVLAALHLAREEPVRGREYFPSRVTALVLDIVDHYPSIIRPR